MYNVHGIHLVLYDNEIIGGVLSKCWVLTLFIPFSNEKVWSLRNKKNAEHWEIMFNSLIEYKAVHGNCLVPSRYSENTRLAKWVENVRSEYARLGTVVDITTGLPQLVPSLKLTADRIKRLQEVGFEWRVKGRVKADAANASSGNASSEGAQASQTDEKSKAKTPTKKMNHDKQWDMMFSNLEDYKAIYGNTNVPKRYKDNPSLGVWCDTQVRSQQTCKINGDGFRPHY